MPTPSEKSGLRSKNNLNLGCSAMKPNHSLHRTLPLLGITGGVERLPTNDQ